MALRTGQLQTGGEKRYIAPKWTRLYRAAKAAKRKGFKQAAEQLGLQAFQMKADTPGIISQEYRQAESAMQDKAAREKSRSDAIRDAYINMISRRIGIGGKPPQGSAWDKGNEANEDRPFPFPPIERHRQEKYGIGGDPRFRPMSSGSGLFDR